MSAPPWWHRLPNESEQEWANRIEEHNPSERDEAWAAAHRARAERRLSTKTFAVPTLTEQHIRETHPEEPQ